MRRAHNWHLRAFDDTDFINEMRASSKYIDFRLYVPFFKSGFKTLLYKSKVNTVLPLLLQQYNFYTSIGYVRLNGTSQQQYE